MAIRSKELLSSDFCEQFFPIFLSADHFNGVVSINYNLKDGTYYLRWKHQDGTEHDIDDRVPTFERALKGANDFISGEKNRNLRNANRSIPDDHIS